MVKRSGTSDARESQGITVDASQVRSQASDVDLVKRRRKQIVDAAVELFAREGFYRTTVQQIAKRANISAGLIYHYARTKEDVLLLALLHVLDTYRSETPTVLKGVVEPLARLRTALASFCRIVDKNLDATVLVYRSTKSLPLEQRELVKQGEVDANEIIAETVRDCIKAKLFREVDVDFATYQLIMNIHMWALKHWHFKPRMNVETFIDESFDFFVHALATPRGLKYYQQRKASLRGPRARPAK
ncbi:MAG: TetR family transcriptional regulator [Pseudolabrys sp.]|nr:TetR family transcriptional regulator [Pseudolabrys sp.]MDP2294997.1 TetR family transcriptional regulator [Pseudolabrys sp.]